MIKLEFKWQDMWIGLFYKNETRWKGVLQDEPICLRHLWICLIPMCPIHIRWKRRPY